MKLAIEQLPGEPSGVEVRNFLEAHAFPLVEERNVTFVYHGAADAVILRHWVYGLESARPFERRGGSDLWFHVMEVPYGSRVEYKIELVRGEKRALIRDPLNPHLAHDPFGANSVCHASGYELPEWTQEHPDSRRGHLEHHVLPSPSLQRDCEVRVYVPARFRPSRRYPLLLVHDGDDYLRYSGLQTVLDNLIHRLEVAPMIVAMITSPHRLTEYANDAHHAAFLARELVPYLEAHFPLSRRSSARGLMGASFGGVAALSTAWRYPGFFGRLLLQSGSFAFSDIGKNTRGPAFEPVVRFMNEFRRFPMRVSEQLYMSCGIHESLIYENRSLVPILQDSGMQVKYSEARDGHNWENWRDRLREGLSWLFPGFLWVVYE